MIDLSIIIVNYNTKTMMQDLVGLINIYTKGVEYEIIVVDNSDQEDQLYNSDIDNLNIIRVLNNGFGSACNCGAKVAKGQYLLFINSDIIISDDVMRPCVDYINQHPDVGILGCKLVLEDKTLDHGCKRGFPTPSAAFYYYLKLDKRYPKSKKYGAYRLTYLDEDEINEVDAVSGAFLMIRKRLFDSLKGFDETFFMYGEDLDLCLRARENKFKVVYFPKVVVTHMKGQSGLKTRNKAVLYNFYKAMIIFYNKHYKKKYSRFVTWLVYLTIWSKYYLDLFKLKVKR